MTVLPDIIREPTVVSAKPSNNVNNSKPTSAVSAPSLLSGLKKLHDNTTTVAYSAPVVTNADGTFPTLIFNDSNRSTAYHRFPAGELNSKLINSPLEANLFYNWPATERLRTSAIKSKSKVYKPVTRVSQPSRPPAPYKVNTSYETTEPHFHNEKRTLEMKRWQYLREHTQWSIYPYAAIDEREFYNKQIRETLKEQMDQKIRNSQREFNDNYRESQIILEKDKTDIETDRSRQNERSKYLNQFSVSNKKLMEDRWMSDYLLKRDEWIKERQLLNENPINWSKTLR